MLAFVFLCLSAPLLLSGAVAIPGNALSTKPVIIDTDLCADVDDVGALAIANIVHNCGLCDLRAVTLNTRSRYGALAVSMAIARRQSWIPGSSDFERSLDDMQAPNIFRLLSTNFF